MQSHRPSTQLCPKVIGRHVWCRLGQKAWHVRQRAQDVATYEAGQVFQQGGKGYFNGSRQGLAKES